jgi:hypothetical protein
MDVSVRGRYRRWNAVTNLPNLTSGTLWRAGILASIAWAIGGALDGGTPSELLAVPVIVAAWISAVVFLDRWVRADVDQE